MHPFMILSLFFLSVQGFNITWREYLIQFPNSLVHGKSEFYFLSNIKHIINENTKGHSYKLGVTPFLHLSQDEWIQRFTNISIDRSDIFAPIPPSLNLRTSTSNFSWVSLGMTTPVKDQGQAGTCYQHAAVETIETSYAIKTGKLLTLSVQQGVDCSRMNNGVDGGLPDYSYKYAKQTAQCSESSYPYTSGTTGKASKCQSCSGVVPLLGGYTDIKDGDENAMLKYTAVTSLAIGIKADDKQFQMYKSGVLDYNCDSSSKSIDHAVVIEGYGTENGKDYWLVRNSWGTSWGESGYIKMKRDVCMCGLCHMASFPNFP